MTPAEQNRITAAGKARPRGWWYPEAKRMRAQGMSYAAIGERFFVTASAVKFAVNDELRKTNLERTRLRREAAKAVRS